MSDRWSFIPKVVPAAVHHPADGARVEDKIGLSQLQMQLRVGSLLAAGLTAGAILGTPLCLHRTGISFCEPHLRCPNPHKWNDQIYSGAT
jgi:hypothetical protein